VGRCTQGFAIWTYLYVTSADWRVIFKGSASSGTTQPSSATSSAPTSARGPQAPVGHGAARGRTQSAEEPNRFYAMSGRQSAEASPDVIKGILIVQSHDVYALIDPGSTL